MIDNEATALFDTPSFSGSPERQLLLAILERAILDLVGNEPKEAASAETWIFEDVDAADPSPYSFAWVCRELDLDPPMTARKIASIPKRGKSRLAPWYQSRHQESSAVVHA